MTEQSNDDLIAEARVIWEADDLYPDQMIPRLVKALEASDQRAEVAEKDRRYETEQKVKLAAVVEKVREYLVAVQNSPGLGETGHHSRWIREARALASTPADVLREHDAALIEGLADEWHADNTGTSPRAYNWLREKARQRREGQIDV